MRLRDHAQNTINPAISLVAYNIILLLIGPPARAPITSIVYHMDEGTCPCPFPVTGIGHRQVFEPKGDHLTISKVYINKSRITLFENITVNLIITEYNPLSSYQEHGLKAKVSSSLSSFLLIQLQIHTEVCTS